MPHIHELIDFTVGVFIVHLKQDKVLLVKHKKYGQRWMCPGGHIELDEEPNQAAIREAKEETGLDIVLLGQAEETGCPNNKPLIPPKWMNIHSLPGLDKHLHIGMHYIATMADASQQESLSDEHLAIRWFTWEELRLAPEGEFNAATRHYAMLALNEQKTRFEQHMAFATKIVESWPKWKQNLLSDSSNPKVAVPREPVLNTKDDGY